MAQLHMPQYVNWDTLANSHVSVLKMFLFYAVPMSVFPPAMIYYAGVTYSANLLPALGNMQLLAIAIVFFITELVMTFLVASIIQRLGETVDIKPTYEDSYMLAVVVPTPLWLAPLFLFVPSFLLNLTAASVALIFSGMLIYSGVPSILKVEEKGHAILLSGSILSAGLVMWSVLMYLTFFSWSMLTSF